MTALHEDNEELVEIVARKLHYNINFVNFLGCLTRRQRERSNAKAAIKAIREYVN